MCRQFVDELETFLSTAAKAIHRYYSGGKLIAALVKGRVSRTSVVLTLPHLGGLGCGLLLVALPFRECT